ncbi:hypothetical protein QFZ32_009104 [Streptomyces canus]|nr:hypothetical protein [Streptomyces canus]
MDQAEFVLFGIGHHDDHTFVVVVPFAGEPAAEGDDLGDALVDVVDSDVEVQAYLGVLGSVTGWKVRRGCGSPEWPR